MYRVSYKEDGKYYNLDFDYQYEALYFFNFSRKLKERSEVKFIIL